MTEITLVKQMQKKLEDRAEALRGSFDYDAQCARYRELCQALEDPGVWQQHDLVRKLKRQKAVADRVVGNLNVLKRELQASAELIALAEAETDTEALEAVLDDLNGIAEKVEGLEFQHMFSGEMDASNAFIDINAGSGGTEAQDWAEMLLRMYLRWAESHGFATAVTEISPGEVAGIKSVTVKVSGEFSYGWLRTETGVHRLVRKSPFDSGKRRHTSFAAVFVSPEVDDEIDIEIKPEDIRTDVYRASGAGGQHVNKTESAVRLTHLPTNIVTQCQNERSQHKNRDMAMKQLKAKLYEMAMHKRQGELKKIEDTKSDIGWGSQIRSYVLDQSRIKDLRTRYETGNTQAVLDGKLDPFIEESLKQGL